jgi:hypothetical protein
MSVRNFWGVFDLIAFCGALGLMVGAVWPWVTSLGARVRAVCDPFHAGVPRGSKPERRDLP